MLYRTISVGLGCFVMSCDTVLNIPYREESVHTGSLILCNFVRCARLIHLYF